MNYLKQTAGCAARQDTGNKITSVVSQLFLLTCFVLLAGCGDKSSGQTADRGKVQTDSTSKPKVNIKVNRRYDERGNVVSFDSTYTSFYSNMNRDTLAMDSLMKGFDRYFDVQHPTFLQKEFSPLFFTDSLRYPDFFHNDFFMRRYELNDQYMRDMMNRMDSIKNRYFEDKSKEEKDGKTL